MSISSYLVLRSRVVSRPRRARAKGSLWGRWYVPWLSAALALVGLLLGTIAALAILTASPRLTPSSHWEHVEELVSDDGLDQRRTLNPLDPQVTVK